VERRPSHRVHPEMYAVMVWRRMPLGAPRRYVRPMEDVVRSGLLSRLRRGLRSTSPWVIDGLLATAFLIFVVVGHFASSDPAGVVFKDEDAFSTFLSVMVAAPYYFRRRAPLAVLFVSEAAVIVLTVADYQTAAAPTVLLCGIYTLGAWSPARERLIGVIGFAAGLAVVAQYGIPGSNAADTTFTFALFAAAYLFGSTVRNRRLYSEQLEARATELERSRHEDAQRAVADERLRIAQELHDVVAHSMGVIAVQAGVGAHVIDSDPAEAKRSLEAISKTSRTTLTEIRRMLGVLREDADASYVPAPGLGDLSRLVEEVGAAGLRVEVRTEGERAELPPALDLTAYRIVQEALTNVLKHAGRAEAVVVVGYDEQALRLEITDDGRGINGVDGVGGHGLIGMRERVGVFGGAFDAGPRVGGGFRVSATLPHGDAS
jgi:signal transduction histidine kinase